jgi:hypothetical protein
MKKIIMALLLFPAGLYATYSCGSYTSDVKAVYEFEDNGKLVDCSGNGNNMTAEGNGGSTQTSPVKYDTYSWKSDSGNNGAMVPAWPQDQLGASNTWTIQWWVYEPTGSTVRSEMSRGNPNYSHIDLLFASLITSYGNFTAWYNNATIGTIGYTPINGWNRINLCFNSGSSYFKIWINGLLAYTMNTAVNVFASNTYDGNFYFGTELGAGYGVCGFDGLDRLIFSTVDSLGAEITPVPPSTPTFTYTITPTFTFTVTPTWTFTSTVTPTDTYTITPTHTYTITPTFTFTSTITPTDTSTTTPTYTFTITPTFTFTSTITPTYTITPTPQNRVINTIVIGYRIERTGQTPHVVYKNISYIEFIYWDVMYAVKPAGITIIPLY